MYYLTTHTRTEHNCLPRVECSCGKFIGSTKVLELHFNNHIRTGASFRCHECNKVYKTEANFNSHMRSMHADGEDNNRYQCECGKTFKEARHLEVHKNTHLPDELKFTHACDHCNKKYSSVFTLRQHIKHVHVKVSLLISLAQSKLSSFYSKGAHIRLSTLQADVFTESQSRFAHQSRSHPRAEIRM